MKYKAGDKVRIKSIDWYNENKDRRNEVVCGNTIFVPEMVGYCEKIVTLSSVLPALEVYYIKEDGGMFHWTDDMIEGLIKEPTTNIWECPKGYQFKDENGNVINATKIVLEKKKKEYPKTYEACFACLETINISNPIIAATSIGIPIMTFGKLIVCRNAYWKMAGEEMGLGKAWEPNCHGENKYTIEYYDGVIIKASSLLENRILAFPTEEMRDAFLENFKELIEQCKELL